MALKTTAEMLELIQNAIVAVLLGQSYTVNGQSVTRADIDDLRKMETHYENKLGMEQNNNPQELVTFNV